MLALRRTPSGLLVAAFGTLFLDARGSLAQTSDRDGDGVPDAQDNCPNVPNPDQRNSDFPDVLPPGGVSAWRFEETPATAAAVLDTIGTNRGTTQENPLRVTGRFDQGMRLNGTTQFVDLPSSITIGNEI